MLEHYSFDDVDIDAVDISIEIPDGARNLILAVRATPQAGNRDSGVLMEVCFRDRLGNPCEPNRKLNRNPTIGNFFYIRADKKKSTSAQFTTQATDVPAETVKVELRGRQWIKNNQAVVHDVWAYFITDSGLDENKALLPDEVKKSIPAWAAKPKQLRSSDRTSPELASSTTQHHWAVKKEILPEPRGLEVVQSSFKKPLRKPARDFKVAMITDEFTFNSFSPEFDAFAVDPETWRLQFEAIAPDILFCESAWAAVSPSQHSWKGKIYGSVKFLYENRTTLFEILSYCRAKGIPTVFWNKEDPTHHHDRVNDFVSTSARFDYVFTTAEECVDNYRRFKDDGAVGVLPFAAQPRIFNPVETTPRRAEAVFAGAWYGIHEERSEKMRQGFAFIQDSGIPLVIHDRDFGTTDLNRKYPDEYQRLLRRAVPHNRTAEIYRQAQFGLNFNTVHDSATMFARRVFELAASGTQIVSDYSPGVKAFFGDDVVFFDQTAHGLSDLSELEIRENTNSALKKTLLSHTYRHRFESVLDVLGIAYSTSRPAPTMVCVVSNREQAQLAVERFNNCRGHFSRLLIAISEAVATHEASAYLTDYSSDFVDVVILSLVRKESVPSTNFLSTPEAVLIDPVEPLRIEDLEALRLHGEYTNEPIQVVDAGPVAASPRWSAGKARAGLRLTAQDISDVLLNPNSVRQILEVSH